MGQGTIDQGQISQQKQSIKKAGKKRKRIINN
jgi:hypothetical protein